MSFGSQTPRQKMINLMYIVLMALLALNVSCLLYTSDAADEL